MKAKKLLAGILSAAMVLSSMALPAFANAEDTSVSNAVELTKALENATDGTIIKLAGGTYDGSFNVDRNNITIKAAQDAKVTIKAQSNGIVVRDNVTGFTVENVTFDSIYPIFTAEAITVTNCTFENAVYPVLIYNNTEGPTGTFTFTGNTIESNTGAVINVGQQGNLQSIDKVIFNNNTYSVATMVTTQDCDVKEFADNADKLFFQPLFSDFDKALAGTSAGQDFKVGNDNTWYTNIGYGYKNDEGNITATKEAGIGDVYYDTLADALNAASNNDTVKLYKDVTLTKEIKLTGDKTVTLDTNGKTLTNKYQYGAFDLNGTNLTVEGEGEIVSSLENDYSQRVFNVKANSTLTVKDVTVKTDNGFIAAEDGGKVVIESGTYTVTSGGAIMFAYGKNTDVIINDGKFEGTDESEGAVFAFNNANVTVNGGNFNFSNDKTTSYGLIDGTEVNWLFCDYSRMTKYPFKYGGVDVTCGGHISVTGGTYNKDISSLRNLGYGNGYKANKINYVADGYITVKDGDNYTVKKSDIKVEDKAQVVSTTVTLDGLESNLKVQGLLTDGEQAIYKTETSVPSADDQKKAEMVKKTEGATREMYDIKVVKYVGGEAKGTIKVTDQPVTLTLGTPAKSGSTVKVTHIDAGGNIETIEDAVLSEDGTTVTFTAPSFSTYVVDVETADVADENIAENIDVSFDNMSVDGKTATFDLVINGANSKIINRFTSSEWTFDLTEGFACTLEPASHVNMIENTQTGTYEFNMDAKTYSDATGKSITLAKVTVTGDGEFEFNAATAKVHATKVSNNIVSDFDSAAATENGKVIIGEAATGILATKKYDLNVNIAFNNAVNDNEAAYQDMTVTISGGDLTDNLVYELGNDFVDDDNAALTYDAENSSYALTISNKLSENVAYTVKVEGAGYRTARYTVNMTGAKTLNFWNNVKDNEAYVEENVGTKKATTFLAGDIVKDNQINIYDLSAVVSYFGTDNLVEDHKDYAKYDLNRDGKIDSKDIAYVLVSWGK